MPTKATSVFTAIDLFSKKAWAVAMKTKSKNEARNAMATILKQIDHKVGSVRSDNGGEFKNPQMEKLMKDNGIKQTFSISGKPQSNGQIERFNGVLKRLIKMTITQDVDQNWPSYLKTLVDNYNSTRSRVTKKTPNELADNTDVETNEKVKANIKKAVTEKNESVMPVVLPVGQRVRLKLVKKKNAKQNELWSTRIYTIYKVFHNKQKPFRKPYYYVKFDDVKFTEKLYPADVQAVNTVTNRVEKPDKFQVSKLEGKREKDGKVQYLVRWTGQKDLSWEPEDQLMRDVPKMIKLYNKKNAKQQTKRKATPKKSAQEEVNTPTVTIVKPLLVGATRRRAVKSYLIKFKYGSTQIVPREDLLKEYRTVVNKYESDNQLDWATAERL